MDAREELDLQALQEAGALSARFQLLTVFPLIVLDGIDVEI